MTLKHCGGFKSGVLAPSLPMYKYRTGYLLRQNLLIYYYYLTQHYFLRNIAAKYLCGSLSLTLVLLSVVDPDLYWIHIQ